jgi:HEAT repeat protein
MKCWNEIDESLTVCPSCGADQRLLSKETFVQKLIRALHHPEPETPVRAASVLGKLRAQEAVPEMIQLMRDSPDPYIAAACAQALVRIGRAAALAELQDMLAGVISVIVRRAVEGAMKPRREK